MKNGVVVVKGGDEFDCCALNGDAIKLVVPHLQYQLKWDVGR